MVCLYVLQYEKLLYLAIIWELTSQDYSDKTEHQCDLVETLSERLIVLEPSFWLLIHQLVDNIILFGLLS